MLWTLFILGLTGIMNALFLMFPSIPSIALVTNIRTDAIALFDIALNLPSILFGDVWVLIGGFIAVILTIKLIFIPIKILKRLILG